MLFFAGAAILVVALALAWWRWWDRLDGIPRAGRFTIIVTTVGGLFGAIFWWQGAEASFAWVLPLLAFRMLGAAATAFGLAGLLALERPTSARAKLHCIMTAIYLVPLTVAITTLHLDRFVFSAPVTWGFFAIVGLLIASSLTGALAGKGPEYPMHVGGTEAAWLALAGSSLGLWGIALFTIPSAPYPLLFVWPADPLTSRLIAAMLITLATAFLLARRNRQLTAQAHLLGAVYGLGVAVAIMVNLFRGLPWPPTYLSALGAIGIVSVVFLLTGRLRSRHGIERG
jgi:hypothetical protein